MYDSRVIGADTNFLQWWTILLQHASEIICQFHELTFDYIF